MRVLNGKVINFDVDGVIAANNNGNYAEAKPYLHAIEQINKAYDKGYYIKLCTARYGDREHGALYKIYQRGFQELVDWMNHYGVKYDEIIMGKPSADLYVDDKGCKIESSKGLIDWENNFWPALEKLKGVDKYNQPITELSEQSKLLEEYK